MTENSSLKHTYLGGLEMDELNDLFKLSIAKPERGSFNYISYFNDRYFSHEVVRDWLGLAKSIYTEAQKVPGYRSYGVEKFISYCQSVADANAGLQTVCD